MSVRLAFLLTGILGAVAVGIGAFAAHKLKDILSPYYLDIMDKAVKYQFYHVLALGLVAVLMDRYPEAGLGMAAWFFVAGIFFFSGSLYLLTATQTKWWGAVTPIGGLSFILGWLWLSWKMFVHYK
jgi:uncharacterized membrane protein YgdD (TMEM256/DUF423 family)